MVGSVVLNSFASVLIATLTTVTSRIDMIAPSTTTEATSISSRSSLSESRAGGDVMPGQPRDQSSERPLALNRTSTLPRVAFEYGQTACAPRTIRSARSASWTCGSETSSSTPIRNVRSSAGIRLTRLSIDTSPTSARSRRPTTPIAPSKQAAKPTANSCSGFVPPPSPPISEGRRRWTSSSPSPVRPCPSARPPVTVAVAVYRAFAITASSRTGERGARRRVARHAVDGAAGERGRAADVQAAQRRAVGRDGRDGPEHDLVQPVAAAAHVAADQVRVAGLQVGRPEQVAGQDAVAEPGGEALDLRLDALGVAILLGPPVDAVLRPVRVRPGRVPALRRALGIGHGLLAEQQERALRQPAPGLGDRLQDLRLGAADVDGAGAADLGVGPGDRAVERPVELQRGRPVGVAAEQRAVPAGQVFAGQAAQRVGHHGGDHHVAADALAAGQL